MQTNRVAMRQSSARSLAWLVARSVLCATIASKVANADWMLGKAMNAAAWKGEMRAAFEKA